MVETGNVKAQSSLSRQVDRARNLMERLTTQNQHLADRTAVVRPTPTPQPEQGAIAKDAESLPPMANELSNINDLLEKGLEDMSLTIDQIDL